MAAVPSSSAISASSLSQDKQFNERAAALILAVKQGKLDVLKSMIEKSKLKIDLSLLRSESRLRLETLIKEAAPLRTILVIGWSQTNEGVSLGVEAVITAIVAKQESILNYLLPNLLGKFPSNFWFWLRDSTKDQYDECNAWFRQYLIKNTETARMLLKTGFPVTFHASKKIIYDEARYLDNIEDEIQKCSIEKNLLGLAETLQFYLSSHTEYARENKLKLLPAHFNKIVDELIACLGDAVTFRNIDDDTILSHHILILHYESVDKIPAKAPGFDWHYKTNRRPRWHKSPFADAVEFGNLKLIKAFLRHDPKPNVLEVDNKGNNILYHTIKQYFEILQKEDSNRRIEILKFFLSGIVPYSKLFERNKQDTSIFMSALERKDVELVKYLVQDTFIDPSYFQEDVEKWLTIEDKATGESLRTIEPRPIKIIKLLLAKGIHLGKLGRATPYFVDIRNEIIRKAIRLLEIGIDVDCSVFKSLGLGLNLREDSTGSPALAKALMLSKTELTTSKSFSNNDLCLSLLAAGADLVIKDRQGNTPFSLGKDTKDIAVRTLLHCSMVEQLLNQIFHRIEFLNSSPERHKQLLDKAMFPKHSVPKEIKVTMEEKLAKGY